MHSETLSPSKYLFSWPSLMTVVLSQIFSHIFQWHTIYNISCDAFILSFTSSEFNICSIISSLPFYQLLPFFNPPSICIPYSNACAWQFQHYLLSGQYLVHILAWGSYSIFPPPSCLLVIPWNLFLLPFQPILHFSV